MSLEYHWNITLISLLAHPYNFLTDLEGSHRESDTERGVSLNEPCHDDVLVTASCPKT